MKLDRIKNTKRGIIFGSFNRFVGLLLPFIIQTITIRKLGMDYVGIKGLFSSILTVFSVAELGFGSAIVYAMYKPIAEDDIDTICALMGLYRKIYRLIGLIILVLGLAITPFLHTFIHGTYPEEISIEIVFLLYLANTVLSYWLFAYKASLLSAYQRTDVSSLINTITQIACSVAQILVLLIFRNFYLFLIASIIATVLNNIMVSVTVDRMYPELKCRGTVGQSLLADIKKKVSGLLIGKISSVTRNSFDSIFMSAFLGLIQAAIYSNYYFVITALNGFTAVIFSSLLGGIGNSIVLNSKEKNYHDMMLLNNLYLVMSGLMASLMLCLYQPFMQLWAGENYLFPVYVMMMFPLYFYITKMGDIRCVYTEGAGLYWEDRWRNILEAVGNIILNYILGKLWGAFGIIIATLIVLFFFGFLGGTKVTFKYYFKQGRRKYLLNEAVLLLAAVFAGGLGYIICDKLVQQVTIFALLLRGLICTILFVAVYWLLFHRTKDYRETKNMIEYILQKEKKTE